MALFNVDSNNTFGGIFVEEAGHYNVKVLPSSKYSKTKTTGNEMLTLDYEVLDGKYAGGQIRFNNVVWTPDNVELSIKRFNTLLVAADVPDGTTINSIEDILRGIIGKTLNVNTEWQQSDYSGKWNLNVKGYDKVDHTGSKPNGETRPNDNSQPQNKQSQPFNSGNEIDFNEDNLPF